MIPRGTCPAPPSPQPSLPGVLGGEGDQAFSFTGTLMLSRFFIDRPVFANVIAVLTVLFGVVALYRLPVERYPAITPPTVVVSAMYPGANAKVVADTVAAPIEQQVNGVE